MTEQAVIDLGSKTVWVAMEVAAPALFATLIVGVIISILQAATQISEQTLAFIPKVIVMTGAMLFFGPWMMHLMMGFTIELFRGIPALTH